MPASACPHHRRALLLAASPDRTPPLRRQRLRRVQVPSVARIQSPRGCQPTVASLDRKPTVALQDRRFATPWPQLARAPASRLVIRGLLFVLLARPVADEAALILRGGHCRRQLCLNSVDCRRLQSALTKQLRKQRRSAHSRRQRPDDSISEHNQLHRVEAELHQRLVGRHRGRRELVTLLSLPVPRVCGEPRHKRVNSTRLRRGLHGLSGLGPRRLCAACRGDGSLGLLEAFRVRTPRVWLRRLDSVGDVTQQPAEVLPRPCLWQ